MGTSSTKNDTTSCGLNHSWSPLNFTPFPCLIAISLGPNTTYHEIYNLSLLHTWPLNLTFHIFCILRWNLLHCSYWPLGLFIVKASNSYTVENSLSKRSSTVAFPNSSFLFFIWLMFTLVPISRFYDISIGIFNSSKPFKVIMQKFFYRLYGSWNKIVFQLLTTSNDIMSNLVKWVFK